MEKEIYLYPYSATEARARNERIRILEHRSIAFH